MKIFSVLALFIVLSNASMGQSTSFSNRPWANNYPIVIDAFWQNKMEYASLKASNKVAAIIFKASGGMVIDKGYTASSKEAKANSFLVASYHLGLNSDPIKQADFYLAQIGQDKNLPMALDIEGVASKDISLHDAEKFIARIFEKTGKYPIVYINHEVFTAINAKYNKHSIFAKCPLWYARFKDDLPKLSTKVWNEVTLWQFACEINCQVCLEKDAKGNCTKRAPQYTDNCPLKIAGTPYDIDLNAYNGTLADLKIFWNK